MVPRHERRQLERGEDGRGHRDARSSDGITWEKPSLGIAEYAGNRDNNIVLGFGAGGVEVHTKLQTILKIMLHTMLQITQIITVHISH